jgi:hypothetical protein
MSRAYFSRGHVGFMSMNRLGYESNTRCQNVMHDKCTYFYAPRLDEYIWTPAEHRKC